jgi:hypothetical protein
MTEGRNPRSRGDVEIPILSLRAMKKGPGIFARGCGTRSTARLGRGAEAEPCLDRILCFWELGPKSGREGLFGT